MTYAYCPVCYGELEVRDVAPCFDCGGRPKELDDLIERRHTYSEVFAFGVPIILCDFCQADFSSYDPEYFNKPKGTRLGITEFRFIRRVEEPKATKDKFCVACDHRLAFLKFLSIVRVS